MGRTVGLFLTGLDNDYQQRLKEDALRRAKHLAFTVHVELAGNDPSRQIAQLTEAIQRRASSGMTAMLVCPVSEESLAATARAATAAGIDWVLLNRAADYLDELRREFPARVIFTVLPDQQEIGRIQGWQVKALAAPGEQVLCITGRPETWSARLRLAGLREVAGSANPIATVNGDWTSEGARRAVEQWLGANPPHAPLGVFVAQNDDMALGTRQAARDAAARWSLPAISSVPIVGCDGSPRFGQRLVRERRLAGTVAVSSAAGPALDWLRRSLDGAARPAAQVLLPVSSFPVIEELTRRAG
jgi:ABC-type sugar transport system substrate-binding protein